MKKMMNRKAGFTLIELIMVIVILGILAAVAVPMYVNLQNDAKESAEYGTVGGIRGGISIWHASALINNATPEWPAALDSASAGDATTTNPFFGNVLDTPITRDWSKSGSTYTGPNSGSYAYTTADGKFD